MQDGILYELIGPHWRLPIYAQAMANGVIRVEIAGIPMLKAQRKVAEEYLRLHCTHREGNTWFFSKIGLEQSAIKSIHEDPEDVVIWNWVDDPSYELVPENFVMAYTRYRYSPIKNIQQAAGIWASLERFMFHWLVELGQPIEFKWGRLDALPLRQNWKQAILGRMLARKQNLGADGDSEKQRREIYKLYNQSFVTSWDDDTKTVRWTIEFTPNRFFHDSVYEFELRRRQKKRKWYLNEILQLLKQRSFKDRLHQILLTYRRETSHPYVQLPHGNFKRDAGEDETPAGVAVPAPPGNPTPVVIGRSMESRGKGFSMVPQDSLMLSVPDLQSLCRDMRDAGGNLGATRKDEA